MERIFRLRKHFRKSKNPVAKLAGVFCGVILECYLWKLERKYGIQFEKELDKRQEETWRRIQRQQMKQREKSRSLS